MVYEPSLPSFQLSAVSLNKPRAQSTTHFGRIHRTHSGYSPEHQRSAVSLTLTTASSLRISRMDSSPAPVIPIIQSGGFVRRLTSGGIQTASHARSSCRVVRCIIARLPEGRRVLSLQRMICASPSFQGASCEEKQCGKRSAVRC